MVVFVDLAEADEDDSPPLLPSRLTSLRIDERPIWSIHGDHERTVAAHESEVDEGKVLFAAALTCYPIALSISSHLDLNDLHSLSMTCHSVHDSLTQYAHQLIINALRCTHESLPLLSDLIHARIPSSESEDAITMPPQVITTLAAAPSAPRQALTTKIFPCARDLVSGCRNCGTTVCRNCTAKAPSDKYLKDRHRRLCQKCLNAPLLAHLQPLQKVYESHHHELTPTSSASSTRSARSVSESSVASDELELVHPDPTIFTSNAFLRGPCMCPLRGVYLCTTCGHNLRANDTTYGRVWTWRSRYSTHIGGGIGTGLGLGDQGQKCGRGDQCLENGPEGVSWVEIDCSEGAEEHEVLIHSRAGTPVNDGAASSNRPGYYQQEVEGIGGVVKKKVRKKVKVGATVYEYDDERRSGKYLEREASGRQRSWCGWCDRVCLGERDRVECLHG